MSLSRLLVIFLLLVLVAQAAVDASHGLAGVQIDVNPEEASVSV